MKSQKYFLIAAMIMLLASCDKKNRDVVSPNLEANFPQIVMLSDEGDGGLEDEDKFSFKITLADRVDPTGKELGGKIIPLQQDVTISFRITDFKGFGSISSYVLDATAFYEIDDCETEDLAITFDRNTGEGTVSFPKGVEEIEVEFETDPALFDDETRNEDAREIEIKLTGISANGEKVVVNADNSFVYKVLDDESIYGKYALDLNNAQAFADFKTLFGLVNEDIKTLTVDKVKEIEVEFEYSEFKAIVVLNETEMITECGKTEEVNKEIEIEADIEEIEDDKLEGDIEVAGAIEQDNGAEEEFVYKGAFKLDGKKLSLTFTGEYDGDETDELEIAFEK